MKFIRQSVIMLVGMLAFLALVLPLAASGATASDNLVTPMEAFAAARYYFDKYAPSQAEWTGASVALQPVTYYSVTNAPVAFEFTVSKRDGSLGGFLIISAKRDWMPILEWSNGPPPSNYCTQVYEQALAKHVVPVGENLEPRIYYFGALSYYAQLTSTMSKNKELIHLRTGEVIQMPQAQPSFDMDMPKVENEWNKITSYREGDQLDFDIHEISGVPSWWQSSMNYYPFCDNGGGSQAYPGCRGSAADPWAAWDGCSPIAGAMVLGYWEIHGYPNLPNDDESFIDDCHAYMYTSNDGGTAWDAIDSGIHNVALWYGYYSFDCVRDTDVTWSDITTQVDANKPFVLSMYPYPGVQDAHSVTGKGYNTDPQQISVHNTWDDFTNWINFGLWTIAEEIKVTPGY